MTFSGTPNQNFEQVKETLHMDNHLLTKVIHCLNSVNTASLNHLTSYCNRNLCLVKNIKYGILLDLRSYKVYRSTINDHIEPIALLC